MELRHLRYFLAAAETSHFRRTARAVHVSQPTLSHQIRQLEKELGTPLFDRVGRQVRLTAAGDTLRLHAQRVLVEVNEARQAVRDLEGLKKGELSVGVVRTVNNSLLVPIIARFTTRHPGVFLCFEEFTAAEIEHDLMRGKLNLAISYLPPGTADIDSVPLLEERLVLIVSRRHRLGHRPVVKIKELQAEPLVLLPSTYRSRSLFDDRSRELGIRPRVVAEINSVEGILATVRSSSGATVLPVLALARQEPGLRALDLVEPTPRQSLGLVRRRGSYHSRAFRAFVEYAHSVAEELPA
jgi:LysR family cyn operon transcriptional activator